MLLLAAGRGGLLKGLPGHTHGIAGPRQASQPHPRSIKDNCLPCSWVAASSSLCCVDWREGWGVGVQGPTLCWCLFLTTYPLPLRPWASSEASCPVCSCRGSRELDEGNSLDPHACSKQEKRQGGWAGCMLPCNRYTVSEYSLRACEEGVTISSSQRGTDACRGQAATKWCICSPLTGVHI